jgi:TRAP-type mannitol/chloroaromatic compound transport system permease large subunit
MLLRVPVGMAMGLVGVTGYAYLSGGAPALKLVGQTSMRTVTSYQFGVIPMFLLMGAFVSASGVSRELFRAGQHLRRSSPGGAGARHHRVVRRLRRDLGLVGRDGGRRFSAVAYPEMRRYGYPKSFATGVIAAGGTLGAMLPPSTGARRLRADHAAGRRQAVPGRHPARACSP